MNELVLIGILLLGGALIARSVKATSGMDDTPVTADNVRKGVSRGWYKAALTRVKGQPAVYLFGFDTNGAEYGDVFPISEDEWQQLKSEGYNVAQV